MEFWLDFALIPSDNPLLSAWWFLNHGGWIFIAMLVLYTVWKMWFIKRQHEYAQAVPYILLAVDVPKTTEQSPLAVEQLFATLSSTYIPGTLYERYWLGRTVESFSFEIVSLGGYIQFLIRTPLIYRDLIEASIYAQYPDAEITEVEDYVNRLSPEFDTAEYDLWGTEFILKNKFCYPIKTYNEFKNELSIEDQFKDPMAALLEVISRIQGDEDIWLQILVTPTNDHWKHQGKAEVKAIVENKTPSQSGWFDRLFFKWPLKLLDRFSEWLIPLWGQIEEEEVPVEVGTVQKLTPGQRKVVEAIEHKISKIGFLVKVRMIYWGRRETFLKGRGVAAVVGAIQQFTALDRNGLVPSKMSTKAEYFLKQSRINRKQRRILRHYQTRSAHRGMGHGLILNTEELATIYHFPITVVKAPLVKKTEIKKAEPPFALPIYQAWPTKPATVPLAVGAARGKGRPPVNLPFVD